MQFLHQTKHHNSESEQSMSVYGHLFLFIKDSLVSDFSPNRRARLSMPAIKRDAQQDHGQ